MESDVRQDRRDERRRKERERMVVHKVSDLRRGEHLVKVATRRAMAEAGVGAGSVARARTHTKSRAH